MTNQYAIKENILQKVFKVKDKDQLMRKRKIDGYALGLFALVAKIYISNQEKQGLEDDPPFVSYDDLQTLKDKMIEGDTNLDDYNNFIDVIKWVEESKTYTEKDRETLKSISLLLHDLIHLSLRFENHVSRFKKMLIMLGQNDKIKTQRVKNLKGLLQAFQCIEALYQSIYRYNYTLDLMADIYGIEYITTYKVEIEDIQPITSQIYGKIKSIRSLLKDAGEVSLYKELGEIKPFSAGLTCSQEKIQETKANIKDFTAFNKYNKNPLSALSA